MSNRRKIENGALALPIFGAILIVPPLLNVFNVEVLIFGAPLIIIYLFSLWILLIIATFFLSRHLPDNPTLEQNNDSFEADDIEGEN